MAPSSQPAQRRIGLTGGIASGKSAAGQILAQRHGLPVLDADIYARQALAPGTGATAAVAAHFGAAVLARSQDGALAGDSLDRAALGHIVFNEPAQRRWLEQLVHPLVRERFSQELANHVSAGVVVLMIPLLFEAGLEDLCTEIWLVDCDESQQLQRLMQRDGLSESDARARIAAQWPLEHKRHRSTVVLNNRTSHEDLATQIDQALGTGILWRPRSPFTP